MQNCIRSLKKNKEDYLVVHAAAHDADLRVVCGDMHHDGSALVAAEGAAGALH